ncbi:uncharacterized protein [Asterias amurensis]|uniref:uncharacterized protein n=1 Tax=Asterias amurensis TaxID=7602 RepID=UPI003AB51411
MNVLIQRESSMGSRCRHTTGMTFFLVVFLAVFGLLHGAPARQLVLGPTLGGDKVGIGGDLLKSRSSHTINTSPPYCNFSIFTSESFQPEKEFKRLVKEGAIFVYLNLGFVNVDFDDPSAYLDDIGDIIDPQTWVWSKGGRGKLLLGAPFDFKIMSLSTLKPGVFSLTVKINASSVCNEPNSTDEETIEEIKRLLQDLTKGEDGTHQAEEGEDDEELMCLEKQLDHSVRDWIFVNPYKLMEETSGFDCWQRDGHQIRVLPTEFWLIWIRSLRVILALFSPMALGFLLQQNPPEKDPKNGVERLSLKSDLPLGLNYTLCNWGNNNNCILIMRCTLFFCSVCNDRTYSPVALTQDKSREL